MKKLILPLSAILVLAACSRSETPQNSEPVRFDPNALGTKALILPGNSTSADFPQSETFNVFAFADLDGSGPDYTSPLMNDVNISYQGGDWKATEGTYLWPSTGTVDFYAYHPASVSASFDATLEKLTLDNVSLGTTIGSQIDPMVAAVRGKIASATPKPTVDLVFKHISSLIAVSAYDATNTVSLQGKIFIKSVKFLNMRTSGDYTEGSSIGSGSWSEVGTISNFTPFSGNLNLSTEETSLTENTAFVVIPVTVTADVENAPQAMEVKYEIGPYTLNGFDYPATPEQTVTVPLMGRITGNTFQNGKRYVFHIGISLDGANNEIMFAPTVDGWSTVNVTGITIDAINATLL